MWGNCTPFRGSLQGGSVRCPAESTASRPTAGYKVISPPKRGKMPVPLLLVERWLSPLYGPLRSLNRTALAAGPSSVFERKRG
jgi:hypothetical protein